MRKLFAYPLLAAVAFASGCGSGTEVGHVEEHNVPTDDSAPQVFAGGQARLDRLVADKPQARCVIEGAVAEVGIERYEIR